MLCLLPAFNYKTIVPSSGHTLYLRAYPEENIDVLLLFQKNKGTLFFSAFATCVTTLPCRVQSSWEALQVLGKSSCHRAAQHFCSHSSPWYCDCPCPPIVGFQEDIMISTFLPLSHAIIEVLLHQVKNESSPAWSFPYRRTFWKVMFVIKCVSGLSTNTEWSPDREPLVHMGTAHLCVLRGLSAAAAFPQLVVKCL